MGKEFDDESSRRQGSGWPESCETLRLPVVLSVQELIFSPAVLYGLKFKSGEKFIDTDMLWRLGREVAYA